VTWTYDTSQIGNSPMMQVRYLVGDTKSSDQQAQDEEINFALTQRPSIYGAAAIVCRSLASKLSREADTVDKDLRTTLSARAKAYSARAAEYDVAAAIRGGALPYAGGISVADKVLNEQDTDRVPPAFTVDMDDNYLPVAPVGNEGTPQPVDDEDSGSV
jgi:hypothetical protein